MEKAPKTVSIVGGGIGGLASAILLAKQGYKVSLYEKNECLGGRASIMHKDGYTFDMGPSRYLMPDIFEEFFESIDEDIHDYLDLQRLSPSYRVFYRDSKKIGTILPSGYTIKEHLGKDNWEVLKKIRLEALLEEPDAFGKGAIYNREMLLTEEDRREKISNNYQQYVFVFFHGKAIGMIKYGKRGDSIFGSDETVGGIFNFYVEKKHRGLGIGKAVFLYTEQKLLLLGVKNYRLLVACTETDSIEMYKKLGYAIIGEVSEEIDNIKIKEFVMEKPGKNLDYLDIYSDPQRMSDTFESMEVGAGKQFMTFLDRAKIQYEIGMEFCKKNYDSIFDFFRRDIMRKGMKLNIRTTIDRYVARFFHNQLIRKIMQYTTVFLGTAPKQTPALYNIMSHCDFGMGVWYPKGGIHEIAKALHTIGLKHGVEYHLNTEVIGCEIENNQIRNLKLNIKKSPSILIINNGSKHIHELELLIEKNNFAHHTIEASEINTFDTTNFDAVILSGGSHLRPVAFHPEDYVVLNHFIINYNKPIIGICLGAQIIAHTYGSILSELDEKVDGIQTITMNGVNKKIQTIEHHRFAIEKLGGELESIAHSDYGIEIFKHRHKEIYGFQYHPECDIEKQGGDEMFLDLLNRSLRRDIVDSKAPRNDELQITSDIYLINADMAWFETSVLPTKSQTYPKSYRDSKIFAPSGFIIYAGVNKKLPNLDHHNLYFCEDRDKNFGQIFDTKEMPDNPSIYVSKITHTDPTMAPEGCENLFILVPIPNGIEISDNQKEQYKNMVRNLVEKMAGEDIVGHISVEEIFTVDNFKSRYNSWNGTALGLAHPIMQTAVFRPNNISKKLDNLFYVGHNTNPGIGVPMVIISAQLALERIKKRFTS